MSLRFFLFETADNADGSGSWEAMASVRRDALAAVLAEADAVLAHARREAPGPRGPREEGGAWDADLQQQDDGDWVVVTLTLTGPWDWGEALLESLGA